MTSTKQWVLRLTAVALMVAVGSAIAEFAPIQMEGDYIWTAVGTDGSLGMGGSETPGLIHDPSGTRTFDADTDYVTPGSPFEGFSVSVGRDEVIEDRASAISRMVYSNNNGNFTSPDIVGDSLEDVSSTSEYDNHVVWRGSVTGMFRITHEFFFNDGDERLNITTRIEALDDLENVLFQRIVDPDPDVGIYGSYDTINTRGFDANNDGDYNDRGDVPPESWVYSEGGETGRTLSLLTNMTQEEATHNTSIDSGWSEDPADTLTGESDGNGDNSIAMAFEVGDMSVDEITELMYAYVMGATIEDILDDEFGVSKAVSKPHTHTAAKAGMRAVMGVLAARGRQQGVLRPADTPDGQGWVVWGRQIGVMADKDADGGVPGYDADIYHSLVGMEKRDGGYLGGLSFGIGQTEIDMDNMDESESDVYTAAVYGTYAEELFYVDGSLVYGFHDIEDSYPGRASSADYNAHTAALSLAIGQEYPVFEWLSLCPEIGGRVMYYDQESYDESGASNRSVDAFDTTYYESSVGLTAKATKTLSSGVIIDGALGVAWLHEFNDDEEEIDFTTPTGSGTYRLQGPEEDLIQTSASVAATINDQLQLEVGVVYEQGRDYSSFGVGGAIGFAF